MFELAKLTWPEARSRLHAKVVAFLPIGSTEPHGPHLPLDVDVTIALAQTRRTGELLAELGIESVLLPALSYGVTNFTDGFSGWISLKPGTLWNLIEDVVTSIEQNGIRRVVLSNGHLEPAHVKVLRGLVVDRPRIAQDKAQIVYPDNTRRRWAATLGEEFASGDCHAGRYESSLVLAADPAAVREAERQALQPHWIGLIERIQQGAQNFLEAGAPQGYCGDPAAASAAEGRELIESLARMQLECVREAWPELFP